MADTMSDSLAVLLAELPVDAVIAGLGDSLFLPRADRARIIRDRFGVPHIYGKTDADAAFGFGYAQAEDHLIPMLWNYRQAAGRLAELRGEAFLEQDFKALLWRIHSVAGERYGSIPEPTRALIRAFVDGVNHYIDVHREALPGWVERVAEVDVAAFSRWMAFLFAEGTGYPELAKKELRPTVEFPNGSNQWAVGPSRSRSGDPIFVMDPHLAWETPFQWYEAHLESREGLNVYGATFFGLPVIVMGHNGRAAWSMTVNDADVFDLYEEKLDPANPNRYFYEKEKRRMSSRRARVRVRQAQGTVEVERELLYTHHGPVYKVVGDWAYAARVSVQDAVNMIGQLYEMNRAQDLEGFERALAQLELPMFNVMYADAGGTLFYVFNARCPVRAETFDWRAPVPGWTSETEWKGPLPFSQLPRVLNPASGFLQNCNTAADLVTVDSGLNREDFPGYLGWGGVNARGLRAYSWLLAHPQVGEAELKALARDHYLVAAEELKGLILRAYNRTWDQIYDPDGRLAMAVTLLRDWDNRADVDSRSTLLFAAWKERFDPLLSRIPSQQQRDVRVLENLALEALRMAVEFLMETYGRLDVPWGEALVIDRGGRTFPVGGSPPGATALHRLWSEPDGEGKFRVFGGSSFTLVAVLSQPVRAWSLLPYGNSEDPASPHYSDQAALQGQDRFKPAWYVREDVRANAERVTTVPLDEEAARRAGLRSLWRLREGGRPEPE